jgi:uncharacterized protein (TIGR02246 family)
MNLRRLALLAAFLCVFAPSLPARAQGTKDDIEEVLKAYRVAYNEGNAKAMAALYAPGAFWLPPSSAPIRGREAIQEMWARHFRHASGLKTKTLKVEVSGDLAYLVAAYHSPHYDRNGNLVLCFKRQESGEWRIVSDIWNRTGNPPVVPLVD